MSPLAGIVLICGMSVLTPLTNISKLKFSHISFSPEPIQRVSVADVLSPSVLEFGILTSIRYSSFALGSKSIPN